MSPTVTVRVSDSTGNETVGTQTFQVAGGETIITGDFAGPVPVGTVARLRGNVRLTGDLHVRGTLLCDPSGVDLDGQGVWDIHTHDGTLNLQGMEKTAWTGWGGHRFLEEPTSPVVGWQPGDRLAVAPTAVGKYEPTEMMWTGAWTSMVRPANSPNVTLVDGRVALPEVANLSQTVTLRNLKRIMIHEASVPNAQTLKWIRVLDSGETGVLGHYPIHFHQIYEHARGSLLEGVVVEGGKNHAFVPHGSYGITQRDCVAYKTTGPAFWWDEKLNSDDTTSDSEDILWDHCLVIQVANAPLTSSRTAGFSLGAGHNVACINSAASCVTGNPSASEGNRQRSGFVWPEGQSRESWLFQNCVGHNNVDSGLLVWQNARKIENVLESFTAYRNGFEGINHGSYTNRYQYHGATLTGNGFRQHAKSPIEGPMAIEDILSDTRLFVTGHNSAFDFPSFYRRCTFPSVVYSELTGGNPSWNVFEDCGLSPTDFNLTNVHPGSVIEVKEGGVLTHRWQSGVWT